MTLPCKECFSVLSIEKQVFNNCKQEGNIGINHINLPDKLVQQYEQTIQSLKEQIALMKLLMEK